MADLSATLLNAMLSRRLPGLDLPPEFVVPDYGGGSIANLASQVGAWLGAGALGGPPLRAELRAPLGEEARQVVMVLIDGMGYRTFRHVLEEAGSPWEQLGRAGLCAPLTTVFPSTTTAALTTLATGAAPGAHGMLGYELWLKEYGVTANMIIFSPSTLDGQPERLVEAGFDPRSFLRMPTLPAHLEAGGVETHAFLPMELMRSGLSRMHLSGATLHPFEAAADLWVLVREHLEASAGRRQFVWVYWPVVDTLSHLYGPQVEQVEAEVRAFGAAMAAACLERLSPAARAGTLFAVTADHGLVPTPPVRDYELSRHPDLADTLHILPTSEHRAAYLFCRPGNIEMARTYLQDCWPDDFVVLDQARAVEAGLYGPRFDPRWTSRLGELLVLARGRAYLHWGLRENRMRGRHGGLSADEMLVPLIAARL